MTVSKTVRRGSSPWRYAKLQRVDPAQCSFDVGEVAHGQTVVQHVMHVDVAHGLLSIGTHMYLQGAVVEHKILTLH